VSLTVLAVTIALLPLLRPAGPGNTAPVDLLIGLFLFVAALGLARRRRPLHIPAGTAILLILLGSTLALIASLDIATGLLTWSSTSTCSRCSSPLPTSSTGGGPSAWP